MFSRSTTMGMESVLQRGSIISAIKVPTIIFPISACITAMFMMSLEFLILFVFMVFFHYLPPITMLFLPIAIGLLFFLGLGLAIPFSVINVHYRYFRSIWTIVMQALFFSTPIVYKLDFLPESIRSILQYSPLVQIIDMTRDVVLEGKLPANIWLLYTVVSVFVIFLIGLMVFKYYRRNLVETI